MLSPNHHKWELLSYIHWDYYHVWELLELLAYNSMFGLLNMSRVADVIDRRPYKYRELKHTRVRIHRSIVQSHGSILTAVNKFL